jgi:DNA polymerase
MSRRVRSAARALKQHVDGLSLLGVDLVPAASAARPPGRRSQRSAPPAPTAKPAGTKEDQLAQLAVEVGRCRACPLHRTRTHPVVSDGTPHAKLVFIGEAPGRDEDLQGKPFVGMAGQLLTKMIIAMGLRREDVYICNVLKDRPPGNRTPLPEEVQACMPFLQRQLAIVQPKVICSLGSVATKALLGPDVAISQVRGRVWDYEGFPLVPTFHPAYLLRNPPAKKYAWVDLKKVKQLLDAP